MSAIASGPVKAHVALWGKGYRVTQDSEEFQRWVPRKWTPAPNSLDARLDAFGGWAALLQPLYAASERDLALLRCVLFRSQEALCCSFARSEDKHKRPTVIVVSTSAPIDWEGDVAHVVARLHALATRLVGAYAGTVKGNPDHVGSQLKNGMFLADNEFPIDGDAPNADDWNDIVRAVKEWNGITGVASPKLVGLGANVVIGTQHEAELAQTKAVIDGYYDVRERAIRPLTTKLTRWVPRQSPAPTQPAPAAEVPAPTPPAAPATNPDLAAINQSLQEMNRTLNRMADGVFESMRRMQDLLFGDPKRRRR
jgi:hypothetical protein